METVYKLLKDIYSRIGFYSWFVPVIFSFGIFYVFWETDYFKSEIINSYRVGISLVLIALFWIVWLIKKYRFPRNKKNKIGLVVAIHVEKGVEEFKTKYDFIYKLKKNIENSGLDDLINIVEVKNHLCSRLSTPKLIRKFYKKIRGHFYLYGRVIFREGEYYIEMDGFIYHALLDTKTKNFVKTEFIKALPKEISFAKKHEFKGFRIAADLVYIAVRYITGIAALVSGSVDIAYKLHKDLKVELDLVDNPDPIRRDLKNKLNVLISDEIIIIAKHEYYRGNEEESKKRCLEGLEINSNNYSGWLLKSILDFLHDEDPEESLISLKKAEQCAEKSQIWRYNSIFIHFWLEDYDKANQLCNKLPKVTKDVRLASAEMIDFTLNYLDQYPQKIQLYYWLGYLSYKVQKNFPCALDYFERFLKIEESKETKNLIRKAKINIKKLKKYMGLD